MNRESNLRMLVVASNVLSCLLQASTEAEALELSAGATYEEEVAGIISKHGLSRAIEVANEVFVHNAWVVAGDNSHLS